MYDDTMTDDGWLEGAYEERFEMEDDPEPFWMDDFEVYNQNEADDYRYEMDDGGWDE